MLHWGNKIAIFYTVFAVSMLSAVIYASMQTFYLVSPDYYQEEIAYEKRINAMKNTRDLAADIQLKVHTPGELTLTFPDASQPAEGVIYFYRPSDANLDQQVKLALVDHTQAIPVNDFLQGNWQVQIHWVEGDRKFYQAMEITL